MEGHIDEVLGGCSDESCESSTTGDQLVQAQVIVALKYNVDANLRYEGPEFEEYCISEGRYLPASRDRTPCITCPLYSLCQPGFEEQVRRIQQGENPSLTQGCAFPDGSLSRDNLFEGLTQEQIEFVLSKIPTFDA